MLTERSDHPSFEQFRSNTCHKLKDLGDPPFITQLLESNQIRACYTYNDLRNAKLVQPLYPFEVLLLCMLLHLAFHKAEFIEKAIPDYLKYNIIELDIRNVC